jgi:hypothetical protein
MQQVVCRESAASVETLVSGEVIRSAGVGHLPRLALIDRQKYIELGSYTSSAFGLWPRENWSIVTSPQAPFREY